MRRGRADVPRQAGKQHIYSYARGVNHRASISSWPVRVWAQAEEGGARVDADAGLAPEGFPSAPHSPRHRSRSPCARVAFPSQITDPPLILKINGLNNILSGQATDNILQCPVAYIN